MHGESEGSGIPTLPLSLKGNGFAFKSEMLLGAWTPRGSPGVGSQACCLLSALDALLSCETHMTYTACSLFTALPLRAQTHMAVVTWLQIYS